MGRCLVELSLDYSCLLHGINAEADKAYLSRKYETVAAMPMDSTVVETQHLCQWFAEITMVCQI